MGGSLKVWFLASEATPFVKTGGLADVAGSLPLALRHLGADVRVGIPFYSAAKEKVPDARKMVSDLAVPLGNRVLPCDVFFNETEEGLPVYFFDQDAFFAREHLYGTPGGDFPDNLERFAFFNHAALLFAKSVGFGFDIVHCHDWQTGLVPAYMATVYGLDSFFSPAASVFTIHNVGYQGLFPKDLFPLSGLPPNAYHPDGVEYWESMSLLKAGIQYATIITTVSPSYGREIQTPDFGMGMEGILQHRSSDLFGILNGVDYSGWDPADDKYTKAPYGPQDLKGKQICKKALIKEMGLKKDLSSRPILAMIARLVPQKGYDLLFDIAEEVLAKHVGLVVLAAGDKEYQKRLNRLVENNPGRMAAKIGFDEPLAHRIMAGADILLVPSRYEPCGLTQIYALKYGTVPVVRATGGLDDTIWQFDRATGEGNGFKFRLYQARDFADQVAAAIETFEDGAVWKKILLNGMKQDFSWKDSASQYLAIYHESLQRHRA